MRCKMPVGGFQGRPVCDQAAASVSCGDQERLRQNLAQFIGVGQVVYRSAHVGRVGLIGDEDCATRRVGQDRSFQQKIIDRSVVVESQDVDAESVARFSGAGEKILNLGDAPGESSWRSQQGGEVQAQSVFEGGLAL